MAKETESLQNQINIIGAGTNIKGDIDCNGDMRIDGQVVGNIQITGKIVIGKTGNINGQITCKNSEIEGKVDGKIFVSELLVLKSTASIRGPVIDAYRLPIAECLGDKTFKASPEDIP